MFPFSNVHFKAKPNFGHSLLLQFASNTGNVKLSPPNVAMSSLSSLSSNTCCSLYQSFFSSMKIRLKTSNCQLYAIFNSYQTSLSIFPRYIQSVNIRLWVQSSIYCKQFPSFPIYSLQLTFLRINGCC